MTAADFAPILVPVLTASISFFAAVVAVVVGQDLGRKSQRAADEARWQREDALRRRTRSEEMARQATDRLAEATDLVGWNAGYARGATASGSKRMYVAAELDDIQALCRPVRRAALEIEDEEIRRHLEKACDMLVNSKSIQHFGASAPATTAWAVQQTTEALISAYLRGERLANPLSELQASFFTRFARAYEALEELWAMYGDDDSEG